MKQQRSTVWLIVTSDSSSIEDYKNFPARTLTASDAPFYFAESADESVPEMVEVNGRFPHTPHTILADG